MGIAPIPTECHSVVPPFNTYSPVEITCQTCSRIFEAKPTEVRRGNAKYCSSSCSAKRPRPPKVPNTTCAWCHAPFYVRKSRFGRAKNGLVFCSKEHQNLAQRLEGLPAIHPSHYGTATVRRNYRATAFRHHAPKCNRCGWNEYVEVLDVHHKDQNKLNINPDNLEILCPNCHRVHHFVTQTGMYEK
jgi:hypothetical protein